MAATIVAEKRRKGGSGRRKIEIQKIQKVERLRSAFSKRYATLFKKAKELEQLCPGSRVAVIVRYPNEKTFKASAPQSHVESVVQKFLASSCSSGHSENDKIPDNSPQNPNFEIREIRPFSDNIENLDCAETSQNPNFPNFKIGSEELPSSSEQITDFLWEDEPHCSDQRVTGFSDINFQEWEQLI